MEYVTKYPKTVSLEGDENNEIHVDEMTGVEELHLIVKESAEKMRKILFNEGFTTVKFEHKQPLQIGDGLSLKLDDNAPIASNRLEELQWRSSPPPAITMSC